MYNFMNAYYDALPMVDKLWICPLDYDTVNATWGLSRTERTRRLWMKYRASQQAVEDWGAIVDIPEDHFGKIGCLQRNRTLGELL